MVLRWIGILAFAYLILTAAYTPDRRFISYEEHPPSAHTGGFGEPTCRQCHFSEPLNAPDGRLALEGIPDTYTPGETYRITVRLERNAMQRAGFQLAGRFAEGPEAARQAGTLKPADSSRTTLTADGSPSVQYVHHTLGGTELSRSGSAVWTVEWKAPDTASGPVAFHAAANAANDDASEFGDFIYATDVRSQGR